MAKAVSYSGFQWMLALDGTGQATQNLIQLVPLYHLHMTHRQRGSWDLGKPTSDLRPNLA